MLAFGFGETCSSQRLTSSECGILPAWAHNEGSRLVLTMDHSGRWNPELVEGMLRVGGGPTSLLLRYDAKRIVILPPGHHSQSSDVVEGHEGQNHALNSMRKGLWIAG